MWADLQIPLPAAAEQRLFGGGNKLEIRPALARLNGAAGNPIGEAFFNYRNGHPTSGMAPVRFGSFKGGVRIYGVGPRGVYLVEAHAGHVRRLLSDALDMNLKVDLSGGKTSIAVNSGIARYTSNALVFETRHMGKWWASIKGRLTRTAADCALPEIREAVRQAVGAGVRRQVADLHANEVGLTTDGNGNEIDLDDSMWEVESIDRLSHLKGPQAALMAIGVTLRSPMRLTGVWHVGRFCGRGYGQLRPMGGGR